MIQSIYWHERNLKNLLNRSDREKKEVIVLQESIDRIQTLAPFRLKQIEAAKKIKGREGFDAEKFMAKDNPLNKGVNDAHIS